MILLLGTGVESAVIIVGLLRRKVAADLANIKYRKFEIREMGILEVGAVSAGRRLATGSSP